MPRLFQPIDIAPLVFFRAAFGSLLLLDLVLKSLGGSVHANLIAPEFHFRYFGFEWVPAPPGNWMYLLVGLAAVSAAGVAAGLQYRLSATLLFGSICWYFLIEQSTYLNHYYLICLLSGIMIFLPANRSCSMDVLRQPGLRSDVAPAWTLWLLRFQMGVVYFYGGLAKINPDWLQGEPVRTWMRRRAELHPLGDLIASEGFVYLVSWGGLLFDLLVVPLLLWRKTRVFAFLCALVFHLTNASLFTIGIFPLLSIAATMLFFRPATHRRMLRWIYGHFAEKPRFTERTFANLKQIGFTQRGMVVVLVGTYCAWQLLMPFRHLLYPGEVSWTEEGHRFAWHMMLRDKSHETALIVRHASGQIWKVDPRAYLSERQFRKMGSRPDMILQFAHYIADRIRAEDYDDFTVHAFVYVQLNNRPFALLIDPNIDLTQVQRSLKPAKWILPLENSATPPEWFWTAETSPPLLRTESSG